MSSTPVFWFLSQLSAKLLLDKSVFVDILYFRFARKILVTYLLLIGKDIMSYFAYLTVIDPKIKA